MTFFDVEKWDRLIKEPDWYMGELWDEYERLLEKAKNNKQHGDDIKHTLRNYFADRLENGQVAIASRGDDLDKERQAIDTVVIHHTSAQPGTYTLPYLNAVHLLQIYIPNYRNPSNEVEKHLKGQPLWSNHLHAGRQVFWGYHWLVGSDGSVTRLLPDSAIGWHAGNWDINCRSVGICLDGDFTEAKPTASALESVRRIIAETYPDATIISHHEARESTECPGKTAHHWLPRLTAE